MGTDSTAQGERRITRSAPRALDASNDAGDPPDAESADETDAWLVEASLADPEQFAPLFDRHAAAIHRYLSRRAGPLADDLLSETFLVAFRRRASYVPIYLDVRPWLFGIATNVLHRHARDEQRRYRALARMTPGESEALDTDAIADRVRAHGLQAELAAALERLSGAERDVLLLAAWAELTYPQIAAALGIPIGTVRSRLHRARHAMRDSMASAWFDSEETNG